MYFLCKALTAFLHLGTLHDTSALCLGVDISHSKTTNKKNKNVKSVAWKRPQKGHLFTVWELNQEGCLFDLSEEHAWQVAQIFFCVVSTSDHEMPQVLTGGSQIQLSK